MKKILFIVNVDWFFLSHRLPIALEAIKEGYEVHIATKITDKLDELERYGLIVHSLELHRSQIGLFSFLYEFKEIFSVIKSITPDIVHLVTIKPVLLGGIAVRIIRVPAVVSAISGLGSVFVSKGLISFLRFKAISLLYRIAFTHNNQLIIFQNTDDQLKLTELAKIPSRKTLLIHGSGVDLSLYLRKPISIQDPIVMFASRLLASKGIREFVDAAKIINKQKNRARFVIVGSPDPMNPESITNKELDLWEDLGIEIWGYRYDMDKAISSANIMVLPSYYGEGLPKVLIEAAASGRPIITTDHPGCRDSIINGVTGLLVPVGDVNALVKSISSLLNDPNLCNQMGIAGRKLAEEKFDIKQVVTQHMSIYDNLLEKINK